MAGSGPVGGVRDNADSLRPFSGAWRVVAAQFALGPRTGPLPIPRTDGGAALLALGGRIKGSGENYFKIDDGQWRDQRRLRSL
jgi:hypothetical protein